MNLLKEDRDIRELREVMLPPDTFEEGFGGKTVIGALFLGLFMLPGSLYLQLFMGQGLGPAARWVTVILFAEVARRSLKGLRQQEIFILFYMTGVALSNPFQGLLWNQYLVQSDVAQAMGVASEIPTWISPSAETIKEIGNTFFNKVWLAPIAIISFQLVITRLCGFGMGYVLYRLTAHGERLPFPLAPVSAQGVQVLAEDRETRDRSRWTYFAVGGMMGMLFGFIYVGIPSLTGSFLGTPYKLLPIPWLDLTVTLQDHLPATPVNIVFDLSLVLVGMVLPFWAVVGGFIGFLMRLIANPILYRAGYLTSWRPGMTLVDTVYSNQVDFYLSATIGLMLAVFGVSLITTLWPLIFGRSRRKAGESVGLNWREAFRFDRLRGDVPVWIALGVYIAGTLGYLLLANYLLSRPDQPFPFWFFMAFFFIYTPLIGYASAKLEGLVGQTLHVPLVQEGAFILSGYKGVAIWFAPMPVVEYGRQTLQFREVELTGTKFTSVIKTELVTIPVIIVATVLFSEFIWRLGPIPSEAYPFTQEVWRLQALTRCLQYTATMAGGSKFIEALNGWYIGLSFGGGIALFLGLSLAGAPTALFFGLVRGMGLLTPGQIMPEFIGALIGRFYFQKKFGRMRWRKMVPIILAGFICGIGLMAMASVGTALIAKSISSLLY
jgi:hypothetical protein